MKNQQSCNCVPMAYFWPLHSNLDFHSQTLAVFYTCPQDSFPKSELYNMRWFSPPSFIFLPSCWRFFNEYFSNDLAWTYVCIIIANPRERRRVKSTRSRVVWTEFHLGIWYSCKLCDSSKSLFFFLLGYVSYIYLICVKH